jgi:hypothetical protein
MKTTVDISDPLLREARKIAARERTTLRALVEQVCARSLPSGKLRGHFGCAK